MHCEMYIFCWRNKESSQSVIIANSLSAAEILHQLTFIIKLTSSQRQYVTKKYCRCSCSLYSFYHFGQLFPGRSCRTNRPRQPNWVSRMLWSRADLRLVGSGGDTGRKAALTLTLITLPWSGGATEIFWGIIEPQSINLPRHAG